MGPCSGDGSRGNHVSVESVQKEREVGLTDVVCPPPGFTAGTVRCWQCTCQRPSLHLCAGKRAKTMAARRYLHVGGASQPAVHVVAANLHIVCGTSPPKVTVRQHIVKQLRVFLEEFTAPTAGMPIIRLIVGDDNLSTREAKEALQQGRDTDLLWEVYSAVIPGRGDHVAVTGATARFIPIAVGMHFHNRGMRCDQHDALCVELSVRGASQPAKEAADQEAECNVEGSDEPE